MIRVRKSETTTVVNFKRLLRENVRLAGGTASFSSRAIDLLASITRDFHFSFKAGELQIINGNWYVTHTGLLRLARRKRCSGIHVEAVDSLCDPTASRFVLKATVYPSKNSSGFVGYGDADPSNVSSLVRGRRDARGRDPSSQSRPPQGVWHRHLLGRGDRDDPESE